MEKIFHYFVYVFILTSSLQLFLTTSSLPLPPAQSESDDPLADDFAATNCHCNSTNLKVKGNFLSKWLDPLNAESRISTITMKADDVIDYIDKVSDKVPNLSI